MLMLYVTCKDKEEAKKIARELLEQKLVACANILQSSSLFHWEGKLNEQEEAVLLLKTAENQAEKAAETIKKLHSYTVPCIIRLPVEANKPFEEWVNKETKGI